MNRVDLPVLEEVGVALIPPLDAIGLADLIELVPRPLADRDEFGVGVALVDGDKLGAKAEADDGGADFSGCAGGGSLGGGASRDRGSPAEFRRTTVISQLALFVHDNLLVPREIGHRRAAALCPPRPLHFRELMPCGE